MAIIDISEHPALWSAKLYIKNNKIGNSMIGKRSQ